MRLTWAVLALSVAVLGPSPVRADPDDFSFDDEKRVGRKVLDSDELDEPMPKKKDERGGGWRTRNKVPRARGVSSACRGGGSWWCGRSTKGRAD